MKWARQWKVAPLTPNKYSLNELNLNNDIYCNGKDIWKEL